MKTESLILLFALALSLTACSQNAAPTPLPTVVLSSRPAGASTNAVTASGEVVPMPKAQLSFPLTGVVKSVDVKAGDKVVAGQTLATLDTAFWVAKVNEAQAKLVVDQAQEKFLVRLGEDQEHIDAANADVEASQAAVESAKATLSQAALTAPFDGTIASVDISPAETVVPGQVVIQIGDFSHFQVETTDLSERDAPNVQIGQTASVSVPALDQTFPGKVVDIARVSSTVGGDVVYKVTIELDSQPEGLLWGMTTNVEIQTGK